MRNQKSLGYTRFKAIWIHLRAVNPSYTLAHAKVWKCQQLAGHFVQQIGFIEDIQETIVTIATCLYHQIWRSCKTLP